MSDRKLCDFIRDGEYLKCSACGRLVKTQSTVKVYASCRAGQPARPGKPAPPREGPGTELKKMLAGWPLYIKTTENCSCNRHAQTMNAWGCDECERRIDEIVGWLRDEAKKRKFPFFDAAGAMLVRRAIKRARRLTDRPD